MEKVVYHASPRQGLITLEPRVGTYPGKWVYATKDKDMAALFLGRFLGDFSCQIGRDKETRLPYLCERFKDALKLRYSQPASIYHLNSKNFKENKTPWKEEVVSPKTEVPIEEEKIEDPIQYLLNLKEKGKILLARYPEKICGIPEDNRDLVEKAVTWIKQGKTEVLDWIKEYHPNLVERVKREL